MKVAPTGRETNGLSALPGMIQWLLEHIGLKREFLDQSRSDLIRARYAAGESLSDLARMFGISPQRVYQIVNRK